MDCCCIIGVALEDSREGKTCGENFEYRFILGSGKIFSGWSETWLDQVRDLGTESSEEEVHGWTFVMGIALGVIVTPVTAHQRASAAEQTQWSLGLDGLFGDGYQLFPKLLHNLLINKVAMLTGIDVIHELSYIDFPSPRLIWLLLLRVQHVNMSTTETKAELPIWQHSLGGPASHLVASWLHWTPSIIEGAVSFSPWNRGIIWIWVCLPCQQCFCQHHHLWTYWMHYSLSWYHTQCFYSDQGISFCSQNNK